MAIEESNIKHTAGGELPETRRLSAAASVLTGRAGGASVLVPIFFGAVLLGGAFYFWRSYSTEAENQIQAA